MQFSTERFTVAAAKKLFISELSDLTQGNPFHRLHQDACDEGLVLISQNTNRESTWYVDHEERSDDEDNELLAYHLFPTPETLKKVPQLTGWEMVLIND